MTMERSTIQVRPAAPLVMIAALALAGCTALTRDVLVKESGQPAGPAVSHCSGSEWMDNSMIAVVPVPIAAFAMPTQELNEIKAEDVLRRCGPPERLVNRGVLTELRLHGVLGGLVSATFAPGVRLVRGAMGVPGAAAGARALLGLLAGPAHGRGAPLPAVAQRGAHDPGAEDRALHCVNCGECNSVCPIFAESKIRLPQMLTHFGEAMRGGAALPESAAVLLDLCMRCGNCEEVCQAGIPHLPLYGAMQNASDAARPAPAARARQRARHVAILAALRASSRYLRDFLHVRPGGYLKRSPASLPGLARYLVLRAEAEAGPAATCIHCGACVAVCPTLANHEFEGEDPRSIVTAQERCIGCGTCVEVCPANHLNGGQTLRVVEAPAREWFLAIEELEKGAPV